MQMPIKGIQILLCAGFFYEIAHSLVVLAQFLLNEETRLGALSKVRELALDRIADIFWATELLAYAAIIEVLVRIHGSLTSAQKATAD